MKRTLAAAAVLALLASVGSAQSKLDQAVAKALEQVQKGKPEEAVKTLTKAAAEAGAEGQLALARLHERLGNLDEAQAAYNQAKATASGPGRADILAAVANFTLRKGTGKQALATANEAVAASPTANALAAQARALVRSEDGPGGLAAADKAVAAGASSAMAHVARGEALIALGRSAEADAALRRAIELDPKSALAWSRLARAQLALAKPAEALASARKASELDDKFGDGFAVLGVAILADNLKNWSDAIAQAQQGAFLDPTNPIVQTAVGKIFEANGQFEQAAGAYRKALQTDPGFAPARLALLQVQLARGELRGELSRVTMSDYEKLREGMTLEDVERMIGRGEERSRTSVGGNTTVSYSWSNQNGSSLNVILLNGKLAQKSQAGLPESSALAEAKKAAAEMPTSPEIQMLIGEMVVRKGDYAEALGYLERATKGLPGNPDGWALLGLAYHFNRRYDEAAEAYKAAVKLAPQNPSYRTTLGLVLGQAGELEEGLAELQKVTSTPGYKDAAGWANLGWIYRNMNRADESIAAYQKALALDPKEEQAALGLGWAYQYTKNYDRAIAAYNQAIQIDPKDAAADANVGIAWCYFFKRDMAQARAFADKAAAAGRSVTQLKANIDKVEKQLAAGMRFSEEEIEKARAEQQAWEERNKRLEAANNAVRSRNPATRARAARDFAAAAGPDAVPALVVLMQTDPNYDVRIAATNALGSLGPAARSALPNIDGMLRQPPYEPPINATAEQLDAQMKDGDYKRALRDARARIVR